MILECLAVAVTIGTLAPANTEPRPQEPPKELVTGTVWIVEKDARRLPLSGSFQFCYDDFYGTESATCLLTAGAFQCPLPSNAEYLAIGRMRIEDRDAACIWTGSLADAKQPLELEARFVPASRVRVRIQETGVELDRCTLEGDPTSPPATELPYAVPAFLEDCPVFGWGPTRPFRARAPGFAWGKVDVDLLAGGDFWIDLVPEAKLEITVVLPEGTPPQYVSISGAGDWHSNDEVTRDGQVVVLEGLRPGRYSVDTAKSGPGSHALIRRAVLDLVAGETRRLTIDLSPAIVPRTKVAGKLRIDPTWGKEYERPRLRFLHLDPAIQRYVEEIDVEPTDEPGGRFAWDAGSLPVGKHFVTVEPFGWGMEFEVEEAARTVELAVPRRVPCKLKVVDAETRETLPVDSISWHGAAPRVSSPVEHRMVQRAEGADHFAFDAPFGPVTVSALHEGFAWQFRTWPQVEEGTELVMALEPDCRIRIQLREGERIVIPPWDCMPLARPLEGAGETGTRSSGGNSITLSVDRPGKYEVSLPAIEGFRVPAPVVVEARRREVVDVVFALVRS